MPKSPKNRGGYLGGGSIVKPGSSWFGYKSDLGDEWSPLDDLLEKKEIEDERQRVERLQGNGLPLGFHPIAIKAGSSRERAKMRRERQSKEQIIGASKDAEAKIRGGEELLPTSERIVDSLNDALTRMTDK